MEDEYKSNSFKSKQENSSGNNKRIEKITTKPAKTKKKNEARKFAEIFMPDDVDNVRHYIFEDVLIPAIKEVLLEAVRALLGMDSNHSSHKGSASSRISYRSYYDNKNKDDRYISSSRQRTTGYDYDDVVCESRGDAEEVLDRMMEIIDQYGNVSVADLYDLVGISGDYTDNKYGWEDKRDIQRATIARLRKDEYLIKLPRAIPLN